MLRFDTRSDTFTHSIQFEYLHRPVPVRSFNESLTGGMLEIIHRINVSKLNIITTQTTYYTSQHLQQTCKYPKHFRHEHLAQVTLIKNLPTLNCILTNYAQASSSKSIFISDYLLHGVKLWLWLNSWESWPANRPLSAVLWAKWINNTRSHNNSINSQTAMCTEQYSY